MIVLKRFWRLFAVVLLVLLVKSVFYQQTTALPLYMDREIGKNSHYGSVIILNQLIVLSLLPFVLYLIYYISAYDVFIIGGISACIAPFSFVFGGNYYTIVAFIIISSIGESLYAPRVIEYCLEISPKGKESGIIAMTTLPYALSSAYTGIMAGFLMGEFCPEHGKTHCSIVWVIISVCTIPAVLALVVFKKYLEEPSFESNPYISCSKEAQHN